MITLIHHVKLYIYASLLGIFLLPVYCQATVYFVDFIGGSDINNGTTKSEPFKHCPGDPNAVGNAGSTILSPGDVVIFKGGVQYDGVININWSGSGDSDNQRIIYDGDSGAYVARWSSSTLRAIIDAGATRDACFNFPSKKYYITINNLELRNGLKVANRGRLIWDRWGSQNVSISYCKIHDAGSSSVASLSGIGIYSSGGAYWKIHHNVFYDCYDTGVLFYPGSNNEIYNNELYDKIVWGIVIKVTHESADNNKIYNNNIHDIYYYDSLGPHTDFIFLNVLGTGQINNTEIYNNTFSNAAVFNDYGGTAMIFAQISGEYGSGGQMNSLIIRNNTFANQHSYYAVSLSPTKGSATNFYIYNNSFLSSRSNSPLALSGPESYTLVGMHIKNNSFKTANAVGIDITTSNMSNIQIDFNNWYSTYANPFKHNGSYYNMNGWRNLGYDSNGSFSDPIYKNESSTFFNMRLKEDSPCINKGLNLSSSFNSDKDGMLRPVDGAWTIGAYEYRVSSNIGAPTGLKVR